MRLSRVALIAAMFSFSTAVFAADSTDTDTTAATTPKTVTCKDGTTSTAGQGACSHHGGVKGATTHSSSSSSSHASNSSTGHSSSTSHASSSTNPKGATAKCKDGTYSHSKSKSGACSKHGGVDTWMGSSASGSTSG
ncbi:MAG TPA: DUF3761 domain-containing protein [Pseudomonadales bacterium]|nr:DUF3761 domain-containing protein [Pseudomonadales bacterium]